MRFCKGFQPEKLLPPPLGNKPLPYLLGIGFGKTRYWQTSHICLISQLARSILSFRLPLYRAARGRFVKREDAVDACLLHGFGETGEVGAVGGMGKGFNQHGGVEPGNHAGLAGDNEFERGVAGGGAEDVGENQRAVVGRGAGKVVLGALDDGGVVVVGLDVQLVDVAKIAVGQDVVSKGGVGGAEGFVGDDEQVNHGGFVWMGIGSLKTARRVQLRWGVALRDDIAAPQAGKL